MAHQPNPFVNPNSRDVQLPGGCKDLNDALEKEAQLLPVREWPCSKNGGIADLRSHVRDFYETAADSVLTVSVLDKPLLFFLHHTEQACALGVAVRSRDRFLKKAIAEVFNQDSVLDLDESTDELKFLSLPLPVWPDDAAQKVIDLMIRGFGVTEDVRLWFLLRRRKKRKGSTTPPG